MKLSIAVTNYSWDEGPDQLASHLRDLAQQADDAGIDTLWVADHLLQMDPTAAIDEPMLEAYTTLGFLAAATRRVQLGTMVTWATIRPPSLLVKMVTTLDVLSNGRAWLGLGRRLPGRRGRHDRSAVPAHTPSASSRLEELLQLAAHQWDGDRSPVRRPVPPPRRNRSTSRHRSRRPRVLIGGMGEHRTLPLVARYARRLQPLRHPRRRGHPAPQTRRPGSMLRCRRPRPRRDRGHAQQPTRPPARPRRNSPTAAPT